MEVLSIEPRPLHFLVESATIELSTALLSRRSFPYYQKFPNVVGDDWSFLCGYIAIFVSLKFRRTKTERAERLLSCSQLLSAS